MEYAIAAIILAVLGFAVFMYARGEKAGGDKREVKAQRKAAKQRRKGDAVMAEPVADEDGWLASARRRLARKLQDDADD